MASERPITISAGDLATLLGAELRGAAAVQVTHIDSLERAAPGALSFIRNARYAKQWAESKASAALLSKDIPLATVEDSLEDGPFHGARALLIVHDADLAMVRALDFFAAKPAQPKPGVHPSASVDPAAKISPSASIGPNCTVSAGAVVGDASRLIANVFLGEHAKVGARCSLAPGVVVMDRCIVGDDCTLHSGVAIGADGFGFRPAPDGKGLVKIPHIGNVVLADHVEVGANSCIDRAKFGSTSVGSGTKIDNLVQIGHNCRVGRSCIICGHVGLSGSVIVGDGVVIGGKVGVADNVEIGAGAKIAAFAGVNNNVPAGAVWMGAPAGPVGEWRRTYAAMRRLGKAKNHPEP
jgi:UDP-3-O-[3-hydroxymyristoyl] glucosamine N-acyltransferase